MSGSFSSCKITYVWFKSLFIINLHFSASVLTSGFQICFYCPYLPDRFTVIVSPAFTQNRIFPRVPAPDWQNVSFCFLSESLFFSAHRQYGHRFQPEAVSGNPPFHPALGGCLSFFHRQAAFTGGKHCAFICRKCIPAPCVHKKGQRQQKEKKSPSEQAARPELPLS